MAPACHGFPFQNSVAETQLAFENSSSQMFENLAKALKLLLIKPTAAVGNTPYNLVVTLFAGAGSDE